MRSLFALGLVLLVPFGVARSDDAGRPPVVTPAPVAPAVAPVRTLDGRYTLLAAEPTKAAANEALTNAVRGLNPGIRDVFRGQLARLTEVYDAVAIDVNGEARTVRVALDALAVESSLDGTPRSQPGPGGRPVSVTHRRDALTLVETIETPNAARTNTFTAEGADELALATSFRTRLLPRPINFVARYGRATP